LFLTAHIRCLVSLSNPDNLWVVWFISIQEQRSAEKKVCN